MAEISKLHDLRSAFTSTQETFEDAKKKSADEAARKKVSYLRLGDEGTFPVRILPLAPVVGPDGEFLPLERKGYEYPLRSLLLSINVPDKKPGGKPKTTYASICHIRHAFPQIKEDLIDVYVKTACEKYADDKALCDKIKKNSFSGGLKWDSKRCMYVLDLDHMDKGIQLLTISYALYKDLEERKLVLWTKLNKNGQKNPCPISSIDSAFPVEITRKKEGQKTSVTCNIDTISGTQPLTDSQLQELFDLPRLPETLYRYTRWHLEATIAYLKQYDEKYDIDVVNEEAVQDCIAQIQMVLPADDTSHFSFDGGKEGGKENNKANLSIDSFWDQLNQIEAEGLDDNSDEGQDLRLNIREFIEENDLEVMVTRRKSNSDLLKEIEALIAPKKPQPAKVEEPIEDDDEEPAVPSEEEEDYDTNDVVPAGNEDTNEPAARPERRRGRLGERRR